MATRFQPATSSQPFRWKLFLMILLIMGSLTTAAIILTLMANPTRGTVHAPPPQPISQIDLQTSYHQNPAVVL